MKQMVFLLMGLIFMRTLYGLQEVHNFDRSYSGEYAIGASVGKDEIIVGVFAVEKERPELVLTLCQPSSTVFNVTNFMRYVLSELEKKYGIRISRACFAAAGQPSVDRDFIQSPHLSFPINGKEMVEQGLFKKALVVNDFQVIGYALDTVDEKEIVQLNTVVARSKGVKTIAGAGSGLGSCMMIWRDEKNRYEPIPLGASFTDFSARNTFELELANHIKKVAAQNVSWKSDNTSWGYMLGCLAGITQMYAYLGTQTTYEETPLENPTPDAIFKHRQTSKRCSDTVALYVRLYARALRNIAYFTFPYGGLYITNSIVENYPELFQDPAFLQELLACNNGLGEQLLKTIPIYLVFDPKVRIRGAIAYLLSE